MLLLCALIAGSSSVWADTKVLTFAVSTNPGGWPTANTTTLTDYTYTLDDVDYTFALKNVKCNSGYLMLTQPAVLGLPAIDGYKLIKVEATNSGSCSTSTKVGISSSSSEANYVTGGSIQTWSTTSTTYTYNLTETSVNTMYYMYVTNKNAQVVTLKLTYETDVPVNEVTFSYADHKGQTVPDYGANITLSKTDVDITNTWYYCAYTDTYATFFGTNGSGTITITPKNGATITKVVFTTPFTDYNGYQSDGTITASEGTLSINTVDKADATETTWEGSADAAFTLTYHRTIRWTSIVVTYTGGTPVCATPIISGNTPFSTYTTVSISCATSGATIQYCTSTDGTHFTGYVPYGAPFQISETTIVKAKASKEGMVDSPEASRVFTQLVTENIAGLISNGTNDQFVRLTDALVTYKYGNSAYLEDASGAIYLYNCAGDLEAGDKLNGYMRATTYTVYNGLPEITAFTLEDGYTKTSGNMVTPTVVTLAQLMNDPESSPYEMYLSKYVKIENATVTSAFADKESTIEQGGYTIVLRDNGTSALTSKVGDFVTVTGHVSIYSKDETTKKQIAVYDQSQIVSTNASIALSSTAIEAPAAGGDGTINVTYNNITTVVAEVKFYESDGTTEATYDWLEAEINNTTNNLDYVIDANTGAARTAYMKVHAFDDELNDVYSDLITITQAVFVPDYATLPFTFNKGKDDIANTNGLTQSGLGNDYGSAPYLKFDGTGDYLVLKINEIPGKLMFDIKGNSFSGGTFNVQVSADGETFVNFLTFTELGEKQTVSEELDPEVRYIKWIYTEKSTGNVGLGNIIVTKPAVVSVGEAGFATYCTDNNTVSFTGVKAYIVTDFSGGNVTLKEITEAPFDTPVIIEAPEGDYKLTPIANAAPVEGNKLQASRGSTRAGDAPAYDYYVLAKKDGKVGFYKLAEGVTIPAGKCFLTVKKSAGAPDYLGFNFGDDTTGIDAVNGSELKVNGEYYNLAGQRVAQPTKGLYIVNGRKVVIK